MSTNQQDNLRNSTTIERLTYFTSTADDSKATWYNITISVFHCCIKFHRCAASEGEVRLRVMLLAISFIKLRLQPLLLGDPDRPLDSAPKKAAERSIALGFLGFSPEEWAWVSSYDDSSAKRLVGALATQLSQFRYGDDSNR